MKHDEIDRLIVETLERLDREHQGREEAFQAYAEELEGRLADVLEQVSSEVERQAEVCAKLSEQLSDLLRQQSDW